jgi:hypothetical protein
MTNTSRNESVLLHSSWKLQAFASVEIFAKNAKIDIRVMRNEPVLAPRTQGSAKAEEKRHTEAVESFFSAVQRCSKHLLFV